MTKTGSSASARVLFAGLAAAILSTSNVVNAWSLGSGTCEVGSNGPAFASPAPHGDDKMGELGSGQADGLYQVVLDTNVLEVGAADLVVTAGTDLKLEVKTKSSETKIKGVLVTLQSADGGKDVSGAFKMSDDGNIQILTSDGAGANASPTSAAVCAAGVSGATHVNADDKMGVSLMLNVGSEKGSVQLTVTVMAGTSTWYFSTFGLNITAAGPEAPTGTGTMPPTSAPVAGGTAETTTSAEPTAAPSGASVLAGGGALSALMAGASALALTWIIA